MYVHERKEKMNRRRLLLPGPAQLLTLPEAKNCEPVYSPPLDNQTVNLQCLVFLAVDWLLSRELWCLPHLGYSICTGEGLSLYSSAHGQPRYNNDAIAFISW